MTPRDPFTTEHGLPAPARRTSGRKNDLQASKEDAAEKLKRLEGDKNLVVALRERNFDGAHYVYFTTVLAQYGVAVLRAWIRDGKIHQKVRDKGFGSLPPEPWFGALRDDPETAMELALETVAQALNVFRDKVLVPGRWNPEGGASLKTFFVGQCCMQFGNVYRAWHAQASRDRYIDTAEDSALDVFADFVEGQERKAVQRDLVERILGQIKDERARTAFYLKAIHGLTYEEIARKMGISSKALEHLISRARAQASGGDAA
jgi:RNA polymerase sigma factor (sigma-70 family)